MIVTKTAFVFITKIRIVQYQFVIKKLQKSDLHVYKKMDRQLRKFVFNNKNYCHSTNVMGVVLSTSNSFPDDSKEQIADDSKEQEGETASYLQESIEREIVKKIIIAKTALDVSFF